MRNNLSNEYRNIYLGILIIYISQSLDIIGSLLSFNFPVLRYSLIILGGLLYLFGIWSTNIFKVKTHYSKFIFALFLLWTIYIIIKGIPKLVDGAYNYINLKQFISGLYLIYVIPFIMFSEPNEYFIKKISVFSFRLSVIYLLFTIPFFNYFASDIVNKAEGYGGLFAVGASLLLLTLHYHSTRVKWIAWLTILVALLINSILARRNQVVYFGTIIFLTILINLFTESGLARRRRMYFLFGILVIFTIVFVFVLSNRGKFNNLIERTATGMESRSSQIEDFNMDLGANKKDLILGRGMFGSYKVTHTLNRFYEQRQGIENGYLQLILKGGLVYLLIIIIISIPAIYKGFFKSKNILCKAFAAIILTYFIDMIGFGVPTLTLKFIFIWVGIGVCYSNKMREYSDVYLKSVIGIK
jgi:hypothetical protein